MADGKRKWEINMANQFKSLLRSLLKELTNSFDTGMIYKNDMLLVKVKLGGVVKFKWSKGGFGHIKIKFGTEGNNIIAS